MQGDNKFYDILADLLVDGEQKMREKDTALTGDVARLVLVEERPLHTLDLKVTKEGKLFEVILQLVLFNGLLMLN